MPEVVQISNHTIGSYLATVEFYRAPDGTITAVIKDMPAWQIEAKETITERFNEAAVWLREGADSLVRQGQAFVGATDDQ